MKLTTKQTNRIIEILNFYSSLIGVDKEECENLIIAMTGDSPIKDTQLAIEDVIKKTSIATGVSVIDMMSHSRVRQVVMARSFAIYKIVEDVYMKSPNMTWGEIGQIFNRDHSTMIHAHRRVADWLESGDRLTSLINQKWIEVSSATDIQEAA